MLKVRLGTFMDSELNTYQNILNQDDSECLERPRQGEEAVDPEKEEQRRRNREAFLKLTVHFLRTMEQQELADCLQKSKFNWFTMAESGNGGKLKMFAFTLPP